MAGFGLVVLVFELFGTDILHLYAQKGVFESRVGLWRKRAEFALSPDITARTDVHPKGGTINADVPVRELLIRKGKCEEARCGRQLLTEVLCEVVYVMEDCYAVPRSEICGFLTDFINEVICPDGDVLKTALSVYRARKKLDLVDCILAARHQVSGDRVFTFDRKLNNAIKSIDETGSAIPPDAFLV